MGFSEYDLGNINNPALAKIQPGAFIGRRNPHGRVFLFESFEDNPLKWVAATSGSPFNTDSTVERSFNRAYDGKASLHLKVTQSLANIDASRAFQHHANRISAEFFFTFNDAMRTVVDGQALFFQLSYYDGAQLRTFRTEHRPHFHQWTAWAHNSGNPDGPTDLPNMVANNSSPSSATINVLASNFYIPAYDDALIGSTNFVSPQENWGRVKLIVDRSLGKYVGVEMDDKFYDISGFSPIFSGANTNVPANTDTWIVTVAIVEDTLQYTGHAYFDAITLAEES